jgi:hypothetical protein
MDKSYKTEQKKIHQHILLARKTFYINTSNYSIQ